MDGNSSNCVSMRRAAGSSRAPSVVRVTRRVSRRNSFTPNSRSMSRIRRLSGGGETCKSRAACVKFSVVATATKHRRSYASRLWRPTATSYRAEWGAIISLRAMQCARFSIALAGTRWSTRLIACCCRLSQARYGGKSGKPSLFTDSLPASLFSLGGGQRYIGCHSQRESEAINRRGADAGLSGMCKPIHDRNTERSFTVSRMMCNSPDSKDSGYGCRSVLTYRRACSGR
ncbi:Uncharacterised protein [Mycobacteroides abscessus subsp. abscessus]|nr:Uncharacterised protein [Mycobacteroides abscessus subsp. abscessus]